MKISNHIIKASLVAAAVITVFCLATTAQAYQQNPQRKFGRGLGNVLFGWTEVHENINRVHLEEGPAAAVSFGLVRGVTHGIGRTVVGFWEIITFPFPNGGGRGYDPIFKPEFPLRDFNENIFPFIGDNP